VGATERDYVSINKRETKRKYPSKPSLSQGWLF
jgi:hypothetical protein